MGRRLFGALSATVLGLVAAGLAATPATAAPPPDRVVAEAPTAATPNVLNGAVRAVEQIGNTVYIGGNFTKVAPPGTTSTILQPYLAAFDASSGQLIGSFDPQLDGLVNSIVAAPDGESIYVGGMFNHAGGQVSKSVARLDADTGSPLGSFDVAPLNGFVWALELVGERLIIGGNFTNVAGNGRTALASLNAATGGFDPYLNLNIAGVHNGGTTKVRIMDAHPDGHQLVIGGNFTWVSGQQHSQVAVIDLGDAATVTGWSTVLTTYTCDDVFDSYMRAVDYSPDGEYWVLVTSGGARRNTLCDTASRWESDQTSASVTPSWVNYSGGDTLTGVEVTESAVYIGGHIRWMNNPFGSDFPGEGAVARQGIAALDVRNGVPLSWNPGRPRGYGVWDFLGNDGGIYVGHDTGKLGGVDRKRIGYLPYAGGGTMPPDKIGALPSDVIRLNGGATAIPFDGTASGQPSSLPGNWSNTRAATMIDDTLYVAKANGTLTTQTFDGASFGQPKVLDLHGASSVANDLATMTGMFFDPALGRLYFTRVGSNRLYYHYFTPESQLIEPRRFEVANVSDFFPALVRGMFLADGQLYYAELGDGALHAVPWANGALGGQPAEVNDDIDWRGNLFLRPEAGPTPNESPEAEFTVTCEQLICQFDASDSNDSDGSIEEYGWDFGDGSAGDGEAVEHTFETDGSYEVSLTVLDDEGAAGSKTSVVNVSSQPSALLHRGGASVNGNVKNQSVTIPASVEPGDGLVLFVSQNGSAALTDPAGWQLVERHEAGGLITTLYQRVAGEGDAGAAVTVSSEVYQKINMELLAYGGTDMALPVASHEVVTEAKSITEHTSPLLSVTEAGSWAVTHFVDKSSSTTAWTPPDGTAVRSISLSGGGGRITSATVDSGGVVGSTYGALVAHTDEPSSSSAAWTVILNPAE
jgi:PKD repeat protein